MNVRRAIDVVAGGLLIALAWGWCGGFADAKLRPEHAANIQAAQAQLAAARGPLLDAEGTCGRLADIGRALATTGEMARDAVHRLRPHEARRLLRESKLLDAARDQVKLCQQALQDVDDGKDDPDGGVFAPDVPAMTARANGDL